jgi:hypothetical protein
MNDECQRPPGRIMPIEGVAIAGVGDDSEHAEPWSVAQSENNGWAGALPPIKTRRQCETAEYIGITKPETPPAWVPEIRPPNPDETPIPVAPRAAGGLRIGFVTGALIAAIGLGWAGGWNLYRLFVPSTKLQRHAHHDGARGRTQEIASGATNVHEISLLPSNDPDPSHSVVRQSPASDAQPAVSSPVSPIVQQNTTSLNVAAAPVQPAEKKFRPRLTPTPDTRPKTIPGWTVRDVFGGTAVLEGPGGIRKVSVGDTIPGVGRVDSIVRWGNRWIVATSRGLMTMN